MAQDYILNTANPKDWDVITLQEPWLNSYGNSCSPQYWRIISANFYTEGRSCIQSIVLINTNLSTDCYTILPLMHSNITAIRFKGNHGYLFVFNIYNEITSNDTLSCLDHFIDLNAPLVCPSNADCVLWLGDFNHHHLMWEDDSDEHLFEPEEYIVPLVDLLYKNDMLLTLPKGIPTLQTPAGNWTRQDNVRHNNTTDNPIVFWNTVPAIHPPLVDHMPIITILNLPLPRSSAVKSLDFRNADWPLINANLSQQFKARSPAMHIKSKEEFYKKVNNVVRILIDILR